MYRTRRNIALRTRPYRLQERKSITLYPIKAISDTGWVCQTHPARRFLHRTPTESPETTLSRPHSLLGHTDLPHSLFGKPATPQQPIPSRVLYSDKTTKMKPFKGNHHSTSRNGYLWREAGGGRTQGRGVGHNARTRDLGKVSLSRGRPFQKNASLLTILKPTVTSNVFTSMCSTSHLHSITSAVLQVCTLATLHNGGKDDENISNFK